MDVASNQGLGQVDQRREHTIPDQVLRAESLRRNGVLLYEVHVVLIR